MREFIPMVSIKPGYITTFTQIVGGCRRFTDKQKENFKNLENNETAGNISHKAAKRIRLAIEWLLLITDEKAFYSEKHQKNFRFKINFVTLTLSSPQIHPDNEIKQSLLNQFLIEARRRWGVVHYLWRAECQKNGNIHFHILMDKFIPWEELRLTWNRIQNKLGYVDRYALRMKSKHSAGFIFDPRYAARWNYKAQLSSYKKAIKSDWHNPNSTDVHSIHQVSNIAAYLSKYCTKNSELPSSDELAACPELGLQFSDSEQPAQIGCAIPRQLRAIQGKLWRLSQSLSSYKSAVEAIDSYMSDELGTLFAEFSDKVFHSEHFSVLFVPVTVWRNFVAGDLYSAFDNYKQEMAPA